MSLISNWLWGTSQLDEAVDKATSELLPAGSEDIALNLEICDQIRSKSVPAKDAMRALKRRLNHKNPNVQLLALSLTDICVKNGGDHFLAEAGSREFVDNLVSILRMDHLNLEVKNTILRLLQTWSIAFEGKPSLGYVAQACKTLHNEGFKFPPKDLTAANSAMVDTQTAPEWIDSDVCLRCRTPFTFTNRKHHCRNCGQVFDQACSSKTMPLPHFGIAQEVRVCDTCHNKMSKRAEKSDKGHRHSASLHSGRHSRARDIADAELQRAIQLSLQEVGAAGGHARPGYVPSQPSYRYSEPPIVDRTTHPSTASEDDDPDLKAAIEASLREANAPKPSAPIVVETPRSEQPVYDGPGYSQSYPPGVVPPHPILPNIPHYDLEPLETDAILTFSQTVEQVQTQGGRDMSRYPAVNELYEKANGLRPKLAMSVDDTGRKEQMLSDMHEQLSQAVKLYDQLLSQQVAQPRWKPSEPAAAPYQNAGPQWAPNGYQVTVPQHQPSYFPPQEARTPTQQSQTQWYAQQPVSPPPQQVSAPYSSGYQSVYQASSPTPVPQAPLSQQSAPVQFSPPLQSQQYSSPPPPQPQQYTFPPQQQNASPQQQYASPPQQQQYTSPPQQQQQQQQQHSSPSQQQQFSSPASPQQQQYSPPQPSTQFTPSSPSLTRQPTVSYTSATPQPATSSLSRDHTVAAHPPRSTPQSYHQPHTYGNLPPRQNVAVEPPQQYYAPPAPPAAGSVSLSQFPVAPTSAPQAFPLYGPTPSIPAGVVQIEERKEALLIDL